MNNTKPPDARLRPAAADRMADSSNNHDYFYFTPLLGVWQLYIVIRLTTGQPPALGIVAENKSQETALSGLLQKAREMLASLGEEVRK